MKRRSILDLKRPPRLCVSVPKGNRAATRTTVTFRFDHPSYSKEHSGEYHVTLKDGDKRTAYQRSYAVIIDNRVWGVEKIEEQVIFSRGYWKAIISRKAWDGLVKRSNASVYTD